MKSRSKISIILRLIAALALGSASDAALADDWAIDAHVTVVEGSYIPWALFFMIDQAPSASCPVGTWISWNIGGSDEPSRIANDQAVFSLLMTAKTSGKTVHIVGNNFNGSYCTVDYIWLTG